MKSLKLTHLIILSALPAAACSPRDSHLSIDAAGGELVQSDLQVAILPFDLDHLLDSLAERAGGRPRFDSLESELRGFQRANQPMVAGIMDEWIRARDSVAGIADRLRSLDHASERYRRLYQDFRRSYGRLAARSAGLDRALNQLTSGERNLALRAARAADSLRSWEQKAYAALPEAAAQKLAASGRRPIYLTIHQRGRADTVIPPGTWWLIARARHPSNPFLEITWNVSFTARMGLPVRVPLGNFNAGTQWRY